MTDHITPERRAHVADRCRVVEHLAKALAEVHGDYAKMIPDGTCDKVLDVVGPRAASIMEQLGDILDGMDALTQEDDWCAPIFQEACRRWDVAVREVAGK